MGSSWALGLDQQAWNDYGAARKKAGEQQWAQQALRSVGVAGVPGAAAPVDLSQQAWKQHGAAQRRQWGQAVQSSMGLGSPAATGVDFSNPALTRAAWAQDNKAAREQAFGQSVWQAMTGGAPAKPQPAAPKPSPAPQPQPQPPARPQPQPAAPAAPSPAAPPAVAPSVLAKASAPNGAGGGTPLQFGYTPNLEGHSGVSLNALSQSDFDGLRRRAFLDGKDSMAGMRQVRELLAQRNGYSAEEARKLSVAALEKSKSGGKGGVDAAAVPSWNLSNSQGVGAQSDYGTLGEKDLNEVLGQLPSVVQAANWPPGGLPFFGEDSVYGVGDATTLTAGMNLNWGVNVGDANTNPDRPQEQATIAVRSAMTEQAPGGSATQGQSSADGTVSGAISGDLADPNQLGGHGYASARQITPGGSDFRAMTNDWAQSENGLRGKIKAEDLSQVAPWQLSQQPIVMNGDATRDGRMAAFAAMGERDPARGTAEVLAASPFGSRDGQSMAGATIDLSHLDARTLYGSAGRPIQVRSGVPGFNPGNF